MTLYTSRVIAQWLGLTERRIRQLRDKGVIAESRPGLYELQPTVTRYIDYLRGGSDDLNQERTLLTRAKREAVERENELKRGDLHRTADIELGLKTVFLNVRGRLLGLPAKLAPVLVTMKESSQAEIFDVLNGAVKEALEDLQDWRELLAETEDDEEETEDR